MTNTKKTMPHGAPCDRPAQVSASTEAPEVKTVTLEELAAPLMAKANSDNPKEVAKAVEHVETSVSNLACEMRKAFFAFSPDGVDAWFCRYWAERLKVIAKVLEAAANSKDKAAHRSENAA